MSCDCGCTSTNTNCTCPEPEGIAAAKIENIVSAEFGAGVDINNGGLGYTYLLYTNSSANNQIVYCQTNVSISCTVTHSIVSTYVKNAAPLTNPMYEDLASTKNDLTHFLLATTLAPGDTVSINLLSDNVNGKALWLQSFIYKYEY